MNLEADQAVQEARFAGACQDQHAGRPAKGNQSCNKPKQVSFLETKPIKVTGPGARVRRGLGPRAWGRACRALGPGLRVVVLIKSPGGRQAKGWETAETAAAEVGAWREAGTGYPPTPPRISGL